MVTRDGQLVELSRTEWLLLQHLATNAGKVVLHTELLTKVWGPEYRDDLQYLRVWVSRVRRKLGSKPGEPGRIKTFQGIGYLLDIDSARVDSPRGDSPRVDGPRSDSQRADSPRVDSPKADPSRAEAQHVDVPRAEPGTDALSNGSHDRQRASAAKQVKNEMGSHDRNRLDENAKA
jgi:DNA-binding winged helix-turn-helix (wHTH) protein